MMTPEEKAAFLEAELADRPRTEAEFREWAHSIVWVDDEGNEITPEFLPEPNNIEADDE